ncbi:prolyl-tRNA synthetase, bacterial, proS [Deinococcus aerius]|uniref:Proline--tRNA ligase n=1 Tax=Deinococcus aerius TaxID=200253 RepID=A0A2I9DEF7_9DEIO|nr:proline--tRNA ligase [Deinococcus aerius]GBF04338.1 prolyl-tRNA synthetase, bacterial, proS [Deinococcus aerius]
MRVSQGLFVTWREAPSEAETRGIAMLTRAGFVRKLGSGLYANLPLMQRVLHKLEAVIRQELGGVAQEVSFPVLQAESLWRESGRWEAYTQAEGIMFTVTDRAGRQLALGPTHEEVAVAVVRELARSYRDLPVSVYQIGRKFRDELRPRFGLLRTREFTMKDGYSFHASPDDLRAHFEAMSGVYARILTRLGVRWRPVEADSGNIGGADSREFMVLTDVGEDEVLYTGDGRYAANAERAVSRAADAGPSPFHAFARHHTPGTPTVATACAALGCEPAHMVKNVLYDAVFSRGEGRQLVPVLVSVRGDHSVNPVKLWNAVQARAGQVGSGPLLALEVAQPEVWAAGELPLGSLAPDLSDDVIARRQGIHPAFLCLCDEAATASRNFTTGANETDWHMTGANWGVQYPLPEVVEVRQAQAGDASRHDPAQALHSARGIEVGHVFQLGTRYARAMNAGFTAADGSTQPFHMGCYGIGVTRLAQAVAEQLSDERGLVWPPVIAPYPVILTVVDAQDERQMGVAETLYARLRAAGVDALLDDRPERAGVKFADADLTGIPYRVTLGRALEQGEAEVRVRRTGEVRRLAVAEVVPYLQGRVTAPELA